ncbi:MAG: asparagine synthase, partial [Propionivibrio sp.]
MTETIALGSPRFTDSALAQMAAQESNEAAWRSAFQQHGVNAPNHVAGDFAIAFNEGGKTFLAIDRFAIRTLCYRQEGNQLRFAERADELADSSTEIDPQAIFDYLYTHAIPSP